MRLVYAMCAPSGLKRAPACRMPRSVKARDGVKPRASIRAASCSNSARVRAVHSRQSAWKDFPLTFLAVRSSR